MDIWYHNDMMGSGMTDLGCGKSWLSTLNEMEDSIRDLQEFVGGGTWHVMDGMEKTCFDLDLKIRSSPYAIHTHDTYTHTGRETSINVFNDTKKKKREMVMAVFTSKKKETDEKR